MKVGLKLRQGGAQTACRWGWDADFCTFNSEIEAKNLLQYLKTKFVRFLVAQVTTTQHISKANFALVPIQDFSKEWTDAQLYKKYGLTDEEIAFIESMIKPME